MLLAAAVIVTTALNGPIFDFSATKSGDVAAWLQFLGAMGAIWFAWNRASQDGLEREREKAQATKAADRQKLINYQIAEDMHRRCVEVLFLFARNIKLGSPKLFLAGDAISEIDKIIEIIDSILISPLPSRNAAIDTPVMRQHAFAIRNVYGRAVEHISNSKDEEAFAEIAEAIPLLVKYAYTDRNEHGPVDIDSLKIFKRWRGASRPNLEEIGL
ncbi:hypothetical protein [Ancylobacter sp. TS-1]|uniref:hypothetical protein n=1 Tax=Ancylobacter sp. TS-1 TaxID=1850374 RepID=UPI001265D0F0|nr:hypothetical protein [Ancylobacter sp. TS-1]QFR32238.1 hypothetical protein GBB76_03410 [Ancylobacter sp. TS-1]